MNAPRERPLWNRKQWSLSHRAARLLWLALCTFASVVVCDSTMSVAQAQDTPAEVRESSGVAGHDATPPAERPVQLHGSTVFPLRANVGELTADKRAAAATKALELAFTKDSRGPTRASLSGSALTVYVGDVPVVDLHEIDAQLAGSASLADYGAQVVALVEQGLDSERTRNAIGQGVFSASLVVFFGLIVLLVLRRVGDYAERTNEWIKQHPAGLAAIRVGTFEVLGTGSLRAVSLFSISVARWFLPVAIIYAYVLVSLSLFDSTRPYTHKLSGLMLDPLSELTARLATSLPIVFVVALAAVALALLVRVMGLFFANVAEGETHLHWLPRDLARPVGILARGAVVLATVVFVLPVVTGDENGAWARSGLALLISVGLAAVPLLAASGAGLILTLGRGLRVGDWVEFDGHVGSVQDVALLHWTLAALDGREVRVPHLLTLFRPLVHHRKGFRVRLLLEVTAGADLTEVERVLVDTARNVGNDARLMWSSVTPPRVRAALSVTAPNPSFAGELLSQCARRLADANLALVDARIALGQDNPGASERSVDAGRGKL